MSKDFVERRDCGKGSLVLIGALLLMAMATPVARSEDLPDLIINRNRLAHTLGVETHTVTRSDCAFVEGCVPHPGRRKLLRFEATIANIGNGDLDLGAPEDNP